uniref:Uncharacterized protein n=1 Tax=Anguilla anguilla TaxID=7936 RepID=A0A0E9UY06_ANGAN
MLLEGTVYVLIYKGMF